jgi:protein O-GlcNAc transferase
MPKPNDRLRGFSQKKVVEPKKSAEQKQTAKLEAALSQIAQLGQSGQFAAAEQQCQQLLKRHPKVAKGWDMLGLIALQQGKPQTALHHLIKAIELDPLQAEFHDHAGVAHCNQGAFEVGIGCYQEALRLNPHMAHVQYNLGLAQSKLGQREAALDTFQILIAQQPNHAPAHCQIGNLYQQQRHLNRAIEHYQQAVQHYPQYAEAWYNLGVAFQEMGELAQAQTAYQQALTLRPAYPEALNGMGTLLERQGHATAAIDHYQRALSLQPQLSYALMNLGNVYIRLEQLAEAETVYQEALRLNEQNLQALDNLIKIKLKRCDWQDLSRLFDRLKTLTEAHLHPHFPYPPSPFNSLFLPFTAAEQQTIAQFHAQTLVERMQLEPMQLGNRTQLDQTQLNQTQLDQTQLDQTQQVGKPQSTPHKTYSSIRRLGYVSGDFRNHAVGHLILQLFELHDRQQFQVYAYSVGPADGSAERQKLMADCDQFRDVWGWTPRQIAEQIQQDQIDILIDLAGYTDYSCPEVFALRPAPIQINYLGYPGTLGANYIDYIIVDRVIAPPEVAAYFTEQCLYLPNSYQLNAYAALEDAVRELQQTDLQQPSIAPPTQASTFAFCCFNKSEKIEPQLFAVWMRILSQVPDSILWLLSDRPETEQNLRTAAAEHGIQPDRLQFAPRVSKIEHLARHPAFDLFLDTLHYNAHVTASDSLWSGVPLITILGETFASRVAASLLNAVGLPELITHSLQDYEQLAVHLATHPNELKQLKEKLTADRYHLPLFNTPQTVRHLEAAYRQAWGRELAVGSRESGVGVSAAEMLREQEEQEETIESQETKSQETKSQKSHSSLPAPHSSLPTPHSITCSIDDGFQDWLSQAKGSVLITTYQAGKVILVGWNGEQVTLLPRQFPKPMGVAIADNRSQQGNDSMALATQQEVLFFANAPALAPNYLPESGLPQSGLPQSGQYDALFLPRAAYFTGDLLIHDLAFGTEGLWAVNTRFSCLAILSSEFSFVPRWQPAFISELAPEDRCHLNGMAIVSGRPQYVTALGRSNTPRGWSAGKVNGGILIHVDTQEIVLQGLSMPHSPRWYQDRLWLLNSGTGELWQVDPLSRQHEVVCALPGFGRGLAFVGDFALVGLSQIREQHIFGGLPIQSQFDRLLAGVAVVNLKTGEFAGLLKFPTGSQELYDVAFLPNLLRPMLLNPSVDASQAITTPEFDYWMRRLSK